MPRYALLISPRAQAAFFNDTLKVAQAELGMPCEVRQQGEMAFLIVEAEAPDRFFRLSFVQGVFEVFETALHPLDQGPRFALHPDFVWGEKYKGKTNETLTQLLINLALRHGPPNASRLLDPMCGRGTSLFWALRYGLDGIGVEQSAEVLPEIRRGIKKWSKLHRQKHKLSDGWIQKANKRNVGKYLQFETENVLRVLIGETANAFEMIQRKPVDMLVTDIPYGVQHVGKTGLRDPLAVLQQAAPSWEKCLVSGGVMAIAFNANLPKRDALLQVFARLEPIELDVSHRMSESILRDVALLRKR